MEIKKVINTSKIERTISFDPRWHELGIELAQASSDVQADFFDGFAERFSDFGSQYKMEMQALYIKDDVADVTKKFFLLLGECMK